MSMDDDLRQAVADRLAETIRRNRERQDTRRRQLAELAERRTHGLHARHLIKLGRTQRKEQPMSADDAQHRTAHKRTATLAPDEIHTTKLPGGVAVEINMLDHEITLTGPRGGWQVKNRLGKGNS